MQVGRSRRSAKFVKSNAVVFAKGGRTLAIGAGQMSRVDSARVARLKAEDVAHANGWREPKTIGSVCASDAFFPFPDGLLQAVQAGSTAVIQPGGSIRDDEVIKAADEAEIAMAFTGIRVLGAITPLGGVAFLTGWASLALAASRAR